MKIETWVWYQTKLQFEYFLDSNLKWNPCTTKKKLTTWHNKKNNVKLKQDQHSEKNCSGEAEKKSKREMEQRTLIQYEKV